MQSIDLFHSSPGYNNGHISVQNFAVQYAFCYFWPPNHRNSAKNYENNLTENKNESM